MEHDTLQIVATRTHLNVFNLPDWLLCFFPFVFSPCVHGSSLRFIQQAFSTPRRNVVNHVHETGYPPIVRQDSNPCLHQMRSKYRGTRWQNVAKVFSNRLPAQPMLGIFTDLSLNGMVAEKSYMKGRRGERLLFSDAKNNVLDHCEPTHILVSAGL